MISAVRYFDAAGVGFIAGVLLNLVVALFGGCAHTLDYDRAHQLGCLEACARFANDTGRTASTGWFTSGNECGCRFDDGSIDVTCERPNADGACS